MAEGWRQRGQQALRAGRSAEARQAFRAAVAADPGDAAAWLALARLSSPRARLAYTVRAIELSRSQPRRLGRRDVQAQARAELRRARRQGGAPAAAGQVMGGALALPRKDLPSARSAPRGLMGLALLALLVVLIAALPAAGGALRGLSWPAAVPPVLAHAIAQLGPATATALPPTATSTATPTATDTASPTASSTASATATASATPTASEPSATPTASEEPATAVPAAGGERWIDVSLSQQRVTAFEGETPVRDFLVSTGTWEHPTVQGQFHIYVKYEAADMAGPGYYLPAVPFVMYFYEDYGLHGTYWHHNFGTPMSHGCVNLETGDAAWLFEWASVGTLVNVHE